MNKMSEKPDPDKIVIVTFKDDGQTLIDALRTTRVDSDIIVQESLEGFGAHLSWDKYVERNTTPEDNFAPIGWDYLNPEPVTVEWANLGDQWRRVKNGAVMIDIYAPIDDKFHWMVFLNGKKIGGGKNIDSLESAQQAAIKFYSDLRAEMPELRM